MANLISGIVALAIALGFLGVLVYAVPSVPLWIVILVSLAAMFASAVESLRGNEAD
jgi:hypothetical protein